LVHALAVDARAFGTIAVRAAVDTAIVAARVVVDAVAVVALFDRIVGSYAAATHVRIGRTARIARGSALVRARPSREARLIRGARGIRIVSQTFKQLG
jgi:hypothetical protein